jgi:hypothetical protein
VIAVAVAVVVGAFVTNFVRDRGPTRAEQRQDEAVMQEVKTQIATLQQQAISSGDPTEAANLQRQMREALEQALPRLSPHGRAGLVVAIKIVNPLMAQSEDYMRQVGEFGNSEEALYHTAKSREDLKARVARIDELDAANLALLQRLENIMTEAEKILDGESIPRAQKRGLLAGFRESYEPKREVQLRIRNLDTLMFTEWRAALNLMHDTWGQWTARDDGRIDWKNPETEQKFMEHLVKIEGYAAEQGEVQRQLLPAG